MELHKHRWVTVSPGNVDAMVLYKTQRSETCYAVGVIAPDSRCPKRAVTRFIVQNSHGEWEFDTSADPEFGFYEQLMDPRDKAAVLRGRPA